MSENEPYIDPNSGAAPQPGGYAGPAGVAQGHGSIPPGFQSTEDGEGIEPLNAPSVAGDSFALSSSQGAPVDEEPEESEEDDLEDDEEEPEPEAPEDQQADSQSLITQGVDPSSDQSGEGADQIPGQEEGEGFQSDATEAEAVESQEALQGPVTPQELGGARDYDELLAKNGDEVSKYLKNNPDERDAVIQAERDRAAAAGKEPRKGVVGGE